MTLEVEIKFYVPDLTVLRERLLAHGAELVKPRVFERNIRYDNAWDGLRRKGSLLRLRQDTTAKLTYKGIPQGIDVSKSQVRVREEIEIEVSDFDSADLLIQRIGYEPRQIYEKYRETFHLDSIEIVLDEMPYGDFVELEGTEEAITQWAHQLHLDWNKRIITNYLGLLDQLNTHHGTAIKDLTFANFADTTLSITDILR